MIPGEKPRGQSFSLGFLSGIGGQLASVALSLPAGIVLARLLGPAGKGAVDLALLVPGLVSMLFSFGLANATSYHIGSRTHPREGVTGSLLGLWILISLVLTPVTGILAHRGWLSFLAPHVGPSLVVVACIGIPLTLGHQYFSSILLGEQRFVAFNATQVVYGVSRLAGIVLLVGVLSWGAMGGVVAWIVSQFLCALYVFLLLRHRWEGRLRMSGPIVRDLLSYGFKGQAGNLLQFFNYRLDTIILGHFRDLGEVGLYGVAVSLAEMVWYVPNASSLAIFPKTAGSREDARQLTPFVYRVTSGLTLILSAALALAATPLIQLLYGQEFRGAISPLCLLLPGVVCLGAAKVLSADLNGRGLPGYNAVGSLISLTVTIGLDLALIPSFGAAGAAVASSLAYFTTFVYTLIVYTRVAKLPMRQLFRFGRDDLRETRQTVSRYLGTQGS